MRPVTVTQTGVGMSDQIRVDYRQPNFKIGMGFVVSGTVTYTIQHSFNGTDWFDNSDPALVGATTNQDTNYAFPIFANRINVTAGTGSVTMTLLQGS